ncbi:MAG: STAS domain-containing protein [Microbispora sp.]|nr:STAS domain-containing protein [Microbispora sp.]
MTEPVVLVGTFARDGTTVIALTGEIDGRSGPGVRRRLMELLPDDGRVLLDMSGVTYLSSAGLRVLLLLHRAAGARIALAGVPPEIETVMAATGLLDLFPVTGSAAPDSAVSDR